MGSRRISSVFYCTHVTCALDVPTKIVEQNTPIKKRKIYGRAHLKCGRRHPVPRVPIASGGAPECRPSTLDTPPRAAARHPDGCGATARNTSLVRPTGSPHRWVSSLRRPRAPQRRVRASWPRLASEQGCLRAARPGVLALGVLAPRTFVCAHEGTGSSHLPRARFVVHERLSAGCAPYGRAWRLSRAACGQPDRVFWLWVFLAPRTLVCAHEGTGSSHRWVSSLSFPRAPQRRVRASWPRLVPE